VTARLNPVALAFVLLIATMTSGCGVARSGGKLVPVQESANPDSKIGVSGDTVRLTTDSVSAEISGYWGEQTGDTVTMTIRNGGQLPFAMKWSSFAKQQSGDTIGLLSASDITGINSSDARTDNDGPTMLYERIGPSDPRPPSDSFTIAPNTEKKISLSFGNAPEGKTTREFPFVKSGDEALIRFAMPGGPIAVRFKLE
jgi:hypothetical protein